jgi:hypothetical protein
MSPEQTERLFARFPRLFAARTKPDTESRMCDGFACGDGWFDLVWRLCEKLDALPSEPVAFQVKEKFGQLRFYLEGRHEGARELIAAAEVESSRTCEVCGVPGVLREFGSRLKTTCAEHGRDGRIVEPDPE